MEPRYQKLQELLKDEATCKKLFVLNAEEASEVLKKEYGLDFTVAELTSIMNGIKDALRDRQSGELGETDLEMVSGGAKDKDYGYGYSFGRFVPAAVVVGLAVASVW